MANRNCTTIDVHDLWINTKIANDSTGLSCKGFIRFNQFQISNRPPSFFKRFAGSRNWSSPHDRWIDTRRCPRNNARERLDTAFCGFIRIHQDNSRRTVINAGCIASRNRAFLVKGRFELCQRLDCCTNADIFISRYNRLAFAALYSKRNNLILETTCGLCSFGLVLRCQCELILIIAAELPLLAMFSAVIPIW